MPFAAGGLLPCPLLQSLASVQQCVWVGLGLSPWKPCRGNDIPLVELRETVRVAHQCPWLPASVFTHNTLAMPSESALNYLKMKCLVAQVAQAQGTQVNLEL